MQLKNSLYTILKKQGEEPNVSFTLSLNPSCFIYQAHFPGEPITPGVCIVQMGKELIEEVLQKNLSIKTVKNVKFLSVLTPREEKVTFSISKLEREDNEVKAKMEVCTDKETKAKLSLVLQAV